MRSHHLRAAALLLALLATTSVLAQYGGSQYEGEDYEDLYGGAYDGYSEGEGGGGGMGYNDNYDDDYGYYQDADKEYYEYYGYYADDDAGYGDDYYDEEDTAANDCSTDPATGKPKLPEGHVSCDIKITMKQAGNLAKEINGIYKLDSCYNNKPLYRRTGSPAGQERVMWYSSTFGDWDVSKGPEPDEMEVLMYGGEMEHVSAPLFVSNWHAQDLTTDDDMDSFMASKADVTCADGTKFDKDPSPRGAKFSGLSPDEMEAKYMQIYSNMKRTEPSPEVNFTFVVMMVVVGLSIVLAVPYFLLQRRAPGHGRKGRDSSFISNFAEVLQRNRKVQGGHVN